MSPRTSIVTLNLGSQTLELAKFYAQPPNGLVMEAYCSRDLPADPTQQESRQAETIAALREMQSELQIKSGPVHYTVAEELIFTRFLELPPVEGEKIKQIVSFEAQQNVPFPIEDVIWDYQKVGDTATGQNQFILAAIKAELIEEINSPVEASGLRASIVDLATMALYNAFRYNYGELNGCSLLIDIGARTTNLLFIEPGRIFTRSVPIGGSTVTAGIAKDFGESFEAAEVRKKREAVIIGTHNGFGPISDDVARVSKVVGGTLTRLHTELQRSINHYCAQQQGRPPERIFLSGGGASTPFIQEFFTEKLQLPTQFFDPLRNVTVAESEGRDAILRSAHLLGEPVGLALRAATDCPVKLNLCPRSVVLRRAWEKRLPILAGAVACHFLSFVVWGTYWSCAAHVIRGNSERVEAKVAGLQRVESQLNEVRTQVAQLDSLATPLIDLINDRSFWPEVIEELNARLPVENIWITDLVATSGGVPPPNGRPHQADLRTTSTMSPSRSGPLPVRPRLDGILVNGLYLFNPRQQEVVVDYFRNLAGSSLFAIDLNKQAKVIKPTTPTNTEWAFPFELRLELRKPVALP